jgi:hydroxymethylbilane synthase
MAKANGGGADAVVVAAAALDRLSITSQAAEILSPLVMLPQVGQGAIALECAADDVAVRALLALVDHEDSHRAVIAERTMLASMGASCSLPVGGWAEPDGHKLHLRGMVASADGRILLHAEGRGADPEKLGAEVARTLLRDCGADRLLGQDLGAPEGQPAR